MPADCGSVFSLSADMEQRLTCTQPHALIHPRLSRERERACTSYWRDEIRDLRVQKLHPHVHFMLCKSLDCLTLCCRITAAVSRQAEQMLCTYTGKPTLNTAGETEKNLTFLGAMGISLDALSLDKLGYSQTSQGKGAICKIPSCGTMNGL